MCKAETCQDTLLREDRTITRVGRLARGCTDGCFSGVCQAQALHLIKALEHKGGLQIAPRDEWSSPRIRVATNVVACLQATSLLLRHVWWRHCEGGLTGLR